MLQLECDETEPEDIEDQAQDGEPALLDVEPCTKPNRPHLEVPPILNGPLIDGDNAARAERRVQYAIAWVLLLALIECEATSGQSCIARF